MNQQPTIQRHWARFPEWLNTFALGLWGALFLFYWRSGKLGLLIHPNYFVLTIIAGFVLLAIAILSLIKIIRQKTGWQEQHQSLLPPLFTSGLLLSAAVIGLLITPKPFTSDTAIQRGLLDTTVATRMRPQAFRVNQSSERRSLIDWVRTLDVYPEPDAYAGQKVRVDGFAVHSPNLPPNYLTVTRFVITCCAADTYPVGLPVKLPQNRSAFAEDRWFNIKGQMATETLNGKRQIVIQAKTVEPIQEPQNPYSY
ncbi:MAG: TIGR03943 family protein [Oscillatoriales cyanobacterium RU_3_3]|nr:TIGR03943 family protein [Oscillatoriales cyanobacterium RU_3_3]